MTALAPEVEQDICVDCNGSGETGTGDRERETGVYITTDCSSCGGTGQVDARWVSECQGCKGRFWTGDGCTHGDTLCTDCRPRCPECIQEQAADAAAEAQRDALVMAGGGWS